MKSFEGFGFLGCGDGGHGLAHDGCVMIIETGLENGQPLWIMAFANRVHGPPARGGIFRFQPIDIKRDHFFASLSGNRTGNGTRYLGLKTALIMPVLMSIGCAVRTVPHPGLPVNLL